MPFSQQQHSGGPAAGLQAVQRAKALSADKQNNGTELFVNAGAIYDNIAPTLAEGDGASVDYVRALHALITTVVDTAAMAPPPTASLWEGLKRTAGSSKEDKYFTSLLGWLAFKRATGVDALMFKKAPPAIRLMQQAALGASAVADYAAMPNVPRDVIVDLLEDVFQTISDTKTLAKFKEECDGWSLDVKKLQFCIMRLLCILYRELVAGDRTRNTSLLFRHAEAAGIMIVIDSGHYAGHLENAWVLLQKVTLGVMHVTQSVWDQARVSAQRAAAVAARAGHDFAFVPAAYHLLFFLTVGLPGQTFEHREVQNLLEDIERVEARLAAWGVREHVLFDCQPQRYLIALRAEWATALAPKKKAGKKKERVTLRDAVVAEEEAPLPAGHLRVTDWRCLDQRFYGFFTYLEPPMQKDAVKCEMCQQPCQRVHRCTHCKVTPYCSAVCAQAHIFDHECDEAPRPWLSPPVAHHAKIPAELGEEGFMGVVPWPVLKYGCFVALVWAAIWLYRRFDDFRFEHKYGFLEAVAEAILFLQSALAARISNALGLSRSPSLQQQEAMDLQPAVGADANELRQGLLTGRGFAATDGAWDAGGGEAEALSGEQGVCSGGVCPS